MTVAYPEGYIEPGQSLQPPSQEPVTGFDAAVLASLATAYFAGVARLSSNAEDGSRAQWGRIAGVSDADLSRWMTYWDNLLDTTASRQANLASSYSRAALRNGGVIVDPNARIPASPDDLRAAEKWLASKYANIAEDSLRTEVQSLRDDLRSGTVTIRQAMRADRIRWLHSPVIAARAQMAQGVGDAPTVLSGLTGQVAEHASDHLRAAERLSVGSINWPTFKNGLAMMYRRIPHAGACGWCLAVSTRLYAVQSFEKGAAWHAACRCSWQLVTEQEVGRYARTLEATDGNYLAAARAAGMYDGDVTPRSSGDLVQRRFDPKAAAADGYVSREATDAEKARLAQERARRAAGIRRPSRDGYGRTTSTQTGPRPAQEAPGRPVARQVAEVGRLRTEALSVKRQAIALLQTDPVRAAALWQEQKRLFEEAASVERTYTPRR